MTPGRGEWRGLLVEWSLRLFAIACYAAMTANILGTWLADRGRHTLLLLVAIEGYTLGLILCARVAIRRDASPVPMVAALYGTLYFALFEYHGTSALIPQSAAAGLQMAALGGQVWSKATLGRSFGVLPAARAMVSSGPYCFVRHPIYAAYLAGAGAFVLANASWRNVGVVALLACAHLVRARREEDLLSVGTFGVAYRDYCRGVRWRLVPGLV